MAQDSNSPLDMTYKPSKWLRFYIAVGIFQAVVTLSWLVARLWLSQESGDTAVGGGLVFGLVFYFVFIIVAPLAALVLIGLPIYLFRNKPRGKWLLLSILALIFSLLPAYMGGQIAYYYLIEKPAYERKKEQEREDSKEREAEYRDGQYE